MLKMANLKYNYDAKFDVLHVSLGGDGRNSYGDDSECGLVFLRDMDTDELTGLTIMIFLRKDKDSIASIPAQVRDFIVGLRAQLSHK